MYTEKRKIERGYEENSCEFWMIWERGGTLFI
jgi:hypothetical protein